MYHFLQIITSCQKLSNSHLFSRVNFLPSTKPKYNLKKKVLNYEIIAGTGGGAVLIIPILDECVLFIKEYAAAVDDYMITLPKGKIDDNEDIYEAANRELQEEVGYKSDNIKFIQKIYPVSYTHLTLPTICSV